MQRITQVLIPFKYSLDFEKDKDFKENDIIGIINTLRNMFGDLSRFEIAQSLATKLNEINSSISCKQWQKMGTKWGESDRGFFR